MKMLSASGVEIDVKLHGKRLRSVECCKSGFQYEVGRSLLQHYPHNIIFEEVYIPVDKMFLDFFIPSLSIVVECHGEQHVKHIKFFHATKKDFNDQRDKDQRKRDFCEINNLKLIEVYRHEYS